MLRKPAPTAIGTPAPTMPLAPSMPSDEVVDVHRPALAAAVAGGLAHQLGHHPREVAALGDEVTVAAVGRGDVVVDAQRLAHADGHRLLADVEVEEARHLARLHQLAGGLLEEADAHHAAMHGELLVSCQVHRFLVEFGRRAVTSWFRPTRRGPAQRAAQQLVEHWQIPRATVDVRVVVLQRHHVVVAAAVAESVVEHGARRRAGAGTSPDGRGRCRVQSLSTNPRASP